MPLLAANRVTKSFGGLVAVSSLDLQLEELAIASIIGPNGAGKTTFFNCVAGFYPVDDGEISFDGHLIHHLRPDQIAKLRGKTAEEITPKGLLEAYRAPAHTYRTEVPEEVA